MPLVPLGLGVQVDTPMMSSEPFLWTGMNIRVRAGAVETLGLFGPLRDVGGTQIAVHGPDIHRRIFACPSVTTGQVLTGSVSKITLLQYDPTSTPLTGTRWAKFDVTPAALPAPPAPGDGITVPSAGRVEIPPVWWFADQEDLIVGGRANVAGDSFYVWDRNTINDFTPPVLARHPTDPEWPAPIDVGPAPSPAPTPLPTGAVAGGIVNRILVLLGATSIDDPGTSKSMTIRWSDRFNFGQWTPSDITLSGELQLEGGSRIVGGGVTGFGVVAWTDKRMAMLRETYDFDVFSRAYVPGGRGMLANLSWCEADGRIWWLDETRTLNVYDGGQPRQVVNTNKYASIERLSDAQAARVYMVPNHEFGEVIIHYPSGTGTECNAQLVYNYVADCWYPWSLTRSAWCQRFGVIPNLAIGTDNKVWQHDLDVALADPWQPVEGASGTPAADVSAVSFSFESNMIVQPNPGYSSWDTTKITLDYLPAPAVGAVDSFDIEVIGYREPSLKSVTESETHTFGDGETMHDYRIGGKGIRFKVSGADVKTVYRFGMIDIAGEIDGER